MPTMEKFYRNQRQRLDVLMVDGKEAIATNHRLAPQRRAAEQRPDRVEIQLGSTRSPRIIAGDGDVLVS